MKSVGRSAAVRDWIDQRLDELEEFHDGTGPTVRQDQRECVRLCRSDVQEMDPLSIYDGSELRKRIQPCFGGPPVIGVVPIVDKPTQPARRDAEVPVVARQCRRPAGRGESVAQIVELVLRDLDTEGSDCRGVRECALRHDRTGSAEEDSRCRSRLTVMSETSARLLSLLETPRNWTATVWPSDRRPMCELVDARQATPDAPTPTPGKDFRCARHVYDVACSVTVEESVYAPVLVGEWVHDLRRRPLRPPASAHRRRRPRSTPLGCTGPRDPS